MTPRAAGGRPTSGVRTGRRRRHVETDEFGAFVRRIVRAYGRRVAAGDIESLAELAAVRDELDDAICSAIRQLNGPEWRYSWAAIGRQLGMTRQAAHERYGHLGRSA